MLILCTACPLILLYAYNNYQTKSVIITEVGSKLESECIRTIAEIDRLIYFTQENVKLWAEQSVMQGLKEPAGQESINTFLQSLFNSFGSYSGFFVCTEQGEIAVSTEKDAMGVSVRDTNWFKEVLISRQSQSFDLALEPNLGLLTINICCPIWDVKDNRRMIGVLSVHLSWSEINTIISSVKLNQNDQSDKLYSLLINRTGKIISAPEFMIRQVNDRDRGLSERNLLKEGFLSAEKATLGNSGYVLEDHRSMNYITGYAASNGYRDFKGLGWSVLIFQRSSDAFAALDSFRKNNTIITLVIILVAFMTFTFLGSGIIQRLEVLKKGAIKIGEGNLTKMVTMKEGDEIDDLGNAFNKMTEELRHMRDNMVSAREEAEKASRSKSDFLANISHELRTPLNGIIGMADILAASKLDNGQLDSVRTILQSGDSLLGLINDLLDVSRIEAGKIHLQGEKTNIRNLLDEICQLLASRAFSKGLDFFVEVEKTVPVNIFVDRGRVRQVLTNLIGNAIKFTHTGYVCLCLTRQLDNLLFEVKDTGIGIDESHREHLFKPFYQADLSANRSFEGSGLGLSICVSLVKAMNGTISYESRKYHGSCFRVSIPDCLVFKEPCESPVPEFLRSKELNGILFSETPKSMACLLEVLAETKWQHQYFDKFAQLRDFFSEKPINELDFIFLDMGINTCDDSRLNWLQGQIEHIKQPILLFCPQKKVFQSKLILKNQPNVFFFNKPITRCLLETVFEQVFQEKPEGNMQNMQVELVQHGSILLVEDNRVNLKVAQRMLERMGFQVTTAANGLEAISALERESFDLILMDCHMPKLDGWEATRRIRNMPEYHIEPPIVALTANAMEGNRERCLESGMNGFLTKPVRFLDLQRTITTLIQNRAKTFSP